MGMLAKDVKDWIKTIPDHHVIAIDDGGGLLVDTSEEDADIYLEVGGIPEDEKRYDWRDGLTEEQISHYFGKDQECHSCAGLEGKHFTWCSYVLRMERAAEEDAELAKAAEQRKKVANAKD